MNFRNLIGPRLGALLLVFAAVPVSAQLPSVLDSVTTQIAAGFYDTCALTAAGGVKCWGDNAYGELGNNTFATGGPTPVDVTGLTSGVAMIAAGAQHNCALTTAGAVQCWGDDTNGQLGNNSATNSATPVPVSGPGGVGTLSGVAAITAGEQHTCALTTAGAVLCWGDNDNGELGNNSTTHSNTPVAVSGLTSGVVAIAAGYFHTCALTTAGAVQCWGYNGAGELGNNSTTQSNTPVAVNGLNSGVAAITAGDEHTCALTTAGAVQCWGYNDDGQLGNNLTTDSSIPVGVSGLGSGVAAIAAGYKHTCALTTASAVQCWGYNGEGQLGNNSTTNSSVPVAVRGLTSAVAAITAGFVHTCALTTSGGAQCWGDNSAGELGNPAPSLTPINVTGLASGAAAIAAGAEHTCALTAAGGVMCWGFNGDGQLGNNTTTDSAVPVAVSGPGGVGMLSGVVAIAVGGYHTCALTTVGAVQCWGFNNDGQLGNNTTTDSAVPVAVSGLTSGVTAIAAGASHTCALTTAGAVQCWGYNNRGQLGNNSNTNSSVPVAVIGLNSGVVAIAAGTEYTGNNYTCALTTAGAVQCWGDNSNGQLGNNTTTDSTVPVAVSGPGGVGTLSGVTTIAAGADHTCALTTTGAVQCWGFNGFGQLGNNSTTDSAVPVAVSGLTGGVTAIALGQTHTCALTTVGAVQCWGANLFGELGNNSTTQSNTPVAVSGLSSDVAAIAAGDLHTCALTPVGGLKCWGLNSSGQLGNNTTTDSHVPIAILTGQSIAFAPGTAVSGQPLATMMLGVPLNLSATATGGGALSFDSWTPDTCTVSGTTVTATTTALCGVRVSQAGGADGANGTLAAAPQQLRLLQVVATTTLSVASSTNPSGFGQDVTFTATLANAFSPTGNIIFCDGATSTDTTCTGGSVLCTVAVSPDPIQCASAILTPGAHSISAFYAGDANNTSSTTAPLSQTVNQGATTTTLNALSSIAYGQSATVSATISVVPPATGTPSGTMTIVDTTDGVSCSYTVGAVPPDCTLTPTSVGAKSLAATYSGDTNFLGSQDTKTLTVNKADQTLTFSMPPTVMVDGTGTVSATSATPNSGNTITYSTVSTNCSVNTSSGLVRGINAGTNNCVITAMQAGNSNYDAGMATQTLSIGQDTTTTLALSVTPNPVILGHAVTITATVGGDPPSGTVTFCDGATTINASCTGGRLLCSTTLVAGATSSTAVCTWTFTTLGKHSLSAFYAGDANYTATTTASVVTEAVDTVPAPMLSAWLLGLLGSLLGLVGLTRVTRAR